MNMNDLGIIATAVMGVIALLGGATAIAKHLYKRGGDERQWTTALDENTASNKELSSELRDFKSFTVDKLHTQSIDHERLVARVDVIEEKLRGKP